MHDVIIIGGGIIGSSIAWQLSRRGLKVLVIERKDTASGAAGATDGVVGYHTKKPGAELDLAIRSIEMFDTLPVELGMDIEYELNAGGMQPVEDDYQWELLSKIAKEQSQSGVDIHMISAKEACALEPNLTPHIRGALYSPVGGKVNPLALTLAFANAAKKNGAQYLYNTKVTGIITEGGRAAGVETAPELSFSGAVLPGGVKEAGTLFRSPVIVNAAGAWAREIGQLAGLDIPIWPRKGQLMVTEPIGPFLRATVQCARYNVIKFRPDSVRDESALRLGQSLSIEQQQTGGLIIGGTREFAEFEEENTFEAIDAIIRRALRFFPALKDVSIIRCFSGFRPYTSDGLPLLGEVRELPGLIMAAGHEGDGIALAPVTGKLIAELITDGEASIDIDHFSPNRFINTPLH